MKICDVHTVGHHVVSTIGCGSAAAAVGIPRMPRFDKDLVPWLVCFKAIQGQLISVGQLEHAKLSKLACV